MFSLFKVQGTSMLPTLASGDFVIASQLFFSLRPGDLVVVHHPSYRRIVKRISRVSKDKQLWLVGDHASSVLPEEMGWIDAKKVHAKVLLTVKK